jgi:hypothetical protein
MITSPLEGTNRLLVIEDNPADVHLLRRALRTFATTDPLLCRTLRSLT